MLFVDISSDDKSSFYSLFVIRMVDTDMWLFVIRMVATDMWVVNN